MALVLAICLALAFSVTNGFLDAAQAIATLVATRAATASQAVALAAAFNVLGGIAIGTAVATTIAEIVAVPHSQAVAVIGSGVLAATAWNVLMWSRGLPSSSGHALVGGLVGSAVTRSGLHAVRWGGLEGIRPHGVAGTLIALAISPAIGLGLAAAAIQLNRRLLRRATSRVRGPVRAGQWAMSAVLSLSHGANDGQKAMGLVAALLIATGRLHSFGVPLWVKLACAAGLSLGTAMGGWRVVRTVGRGLFRLDSLDAFSSQVASAGVILAAAYAGAPVSTTHVVASSVVGVGTGRRRFRHVHWSIVRAMAFGWLVTLPAAGLLGAVSLIAWKAVG